MPLDPYVTLGLKADATDADIRQAYRRHARIHHPDRNPDDPHATTRFQLVKEAYEILKDPERRARFDAGEDPAAFNLHAGAVNVLCTVFLEGLRKHGDRGIIEHMRRHIRGKVRDMKANVRAGEKACGQFDAIRGRFTFAGNGPNVLADALDSQQAKIRSELTRLNRQVETWEHALELLEAYADTKDPELMFFSAATGATSTSTAL